jgi:hypothetical protein
MKIRTIFYLVLLIIYSCTGKRGNENQKIYEGRNIVSDHGMVEPYPLDEWGFHSPKSIHLIAEAERRTFADRAEFSGDPDFIDVPVIGLLDPEYLCRRLADSHETGNPEYIWPDRWLCQCH